jgi:tetratricopeptide (TPR) repeat protein
VLVATVAAYHNSLNGALIFDDISSVLRNQSIRSLSAAFFPSDSSALGGRSVANLTFFANYALHGFDVAGYHIFNIAIHYLNALIILAIVQKTLNSRRLKDRFGSASLQLATATAVLWVVHPLQTNTVNYISQRTELLMGFFYLFTLYSFIQGTRSKASAFWWSVATVSSVLGAFCKEVIVTVPLIALLYDRTFLSGSWKDSWRQHRFALAGVAACWVVVAFNVTLIDRGNVGVDYGISRWEYALTSCRSLAVYAKLSVWPTPLVFDYGTHFSRTLSEVWPQASGVLLSGILIAFSLWKFPVIGFSGAWFILILLPVSSIVPILGQPTSEHRVYLSLASAMACLVVLLYIAMRENSRWAFVALAIIGIGMVNQRNQDYQSPISIWSDTVRKLPTNLRARSNLGLELIEAKRPIEAINVLKETVVLRQDQSGAHTQMLPAGWDSDLQAALGIALAEDGRTVDAIAALTEACKLNPRNRDAHYNLGNFLSKLARYPEAIPFLERAVRLNAKDTAARTILFQALVMTGMFQKAEETAAEFVKDNPINVDWLINLADALVLQERYPEAKRKYKELLKVAPDNQIATERLKHLSAF